MCAVNARNMMINERQLAQTFVQLLPAAESFWGAVMGPRSHQHDKVSWTMESPKWTCNAIDKILYLQTGQLENLQMLMEMNMWNILKTL